MPAHSDYSGKAISFHFSAPAYVMEYGNARFLIANRGHLDRMVCNNDGPRRKSTAENLIPK